MSVSGKPIYCVHRTTWEDGRMAGVSCNGVDVGSISAFGGDDDEPFVCDRCGVRLRLVWNVRLEQITEELDANPTG